MRFNEVDFSELKKLRQPAIFPRKINLDERLQGANRKTPQAVP